VTGNRSLRIFIPGRWPWRSLSKGKPILWLSAAARRRYPPSAKYRGLRWQRFALAAMLAALKSLQRRRPRIGAPGGSLCQRASLTALQWRPQRIALAMAKAAARAKPSGYGAESISIRNSSAGQRRARRASAHQIDMK